MKRVQFTNTGTGLVTIGGVKLVPGDTNPKNTTIPSEATIARWKRDQTPGIVAKVKEDLAKKGTPAANMKEAVEAETERRLAAALDDLANTLLEGVRGAPVVRAGIVKEGAAAMPPARPDPASGSVTASLTALDAPKALALIKMCQDLKTIDAWTTAETQSQNPRKEITDALLARAEVLAKG